MFERSEPVLKIVCVALAAALAFEAVRVAMRYNPVGRLKVPELPTLAAKTNAATDVKNTNALPAKTEIKKGTNTTSEPTAGKTGTNVVPEDVAKKKDTTTNATPVAAAEKAMTNAVAVTNTPEKKEMDVAVAAAVEKKGTNGISSKDFGKMNTNAVSGMAAIKNGTNLATNTGTNGGTNLVVTKGRTNGMPGMPGMAGMGRRGGPGQMGGEKLPELPAVIQARIDRIIQSEVMAQLTRPQPAALIGILGNGAMLRTPSGQSGYVKEGGELGGIKLLSIGMNRVLVEEEGQKKELMIFSGLGGETLLPKQSETNETKTP